jgi:hypothetical protein
VTLLLHPLVQGQVLQFRLHPRPHLHPAMAMQQQLPLIPLPLARHPDPWKSLLQQQRQNMDRIALVGLLLAHVAGTNPGRIADPKLMAQLLHQPFKPQ